LLADPISDGHLVLSPQGSSSSAETHAAMVVSQASFSNVRFSAGFETVDQLRTGSAPNPWESAWAIFGYTDDEHFYYVAFKTNGWELGKVDPAYPGGQRYLVDKASPAFAVGTEHSFDIQQDGNVIKVWADGALLTTFTDNQRPYLSGKVGFYTEDATVAFDNVSGSISDNFESYAAHTFGDGDTLGSKWETPYVGYGYAAIQGPDAAPAVPTIVGTAGDDALTGTTRNDVIDGGAGADRMVGRAGADTYKVDESGDRIVEYAGKGQDTVLSGADGFKLAANVENLTLIGGFGQVGSGNALDNTLVSNYSRGILNGGGGDDTLISGFGSDRLIGGAGADTFVFGQAHPEDGTVRHVRDFQPGVDTLDLSALLQGYTGADPVADGHLRLRENAAGGTNLYYDVDGHGGAPGQLVAAIDGVTPAQLHPDKDFIWH
jgi:Ca2+-binding RTX toxin-like protein